MSEVKQEAFTKRELESLRTARTKEMRIQLTSFAMMIFLTFISFGMVALEFDKKIVIPIILLLAFVQVILQFFYFMHMKDQGHEFAKLFILVGIYLAIAFIVTFLLIVWIGTGGIS